MRALRGFELHGVVRAENADLAGSGERKAAQSLLIDQARAPVHLHQPLIGAQGLAPSLNGPPTGHKVPQLR